MDARIVLIVVLVVGLLVGIWPLLSAPQRPDVDATPATVEDLKAYDAAIGALAPETPAGVPTARVRLPESGLYVELRGLSESEYNSFMVQGVGIELIERQMLAAAFVQPAMTAADVGALAPGLGRFLKRAINALSGFAVFDAGLE